MVVVANDSGVTSTTAAMATVVVLRFVNLNANAADMHASDRLIDELIGMLCQVPGLFVIARMSMFALRDRSLGVRAATHSSRVAGLLENRTRPARRSGELARDRHCKDTVASRSWKRCSVRHDLLRSTCARGWGQRARTRHSNLDQHRQSALCRFWCN